ncbi:MAG TPA: beta-propeller fold lactonase family protein [Thermoanaerobaculia bacterium]|jgi:DNA-binding beta-propeller fold protein YncE|nr:beta-propeller fold lactonase family protein [Thermoanaerobaculia bacterium]
MNVAKNGGKICVLLLGSFVGLAGLAGLKPAAAEPGHFTLFESGQVRPLALSPTGKFLFAANTPDNRLEVFRIKNHGLEHLSSISVGLEPVAVGARSDKEIWVVNHLSDSVSVVELAQGGQSGRVVRTLLVGDEPRDVVFGGPGKKRAFITTAHRGQNVPYDPRLTTPGVGRADVWVFDADHLGGTLTGTPLTIITLFADTPRALAVSPDGGRVYVAAFHSGNRTTTVHEAFVPNGGQALGGLPAPNTNVDGVHQPEVGLIVRFNGTHWEDELHRVWDDQVRFSLPDKDVFVINANANPPVQLAGAAGSYSGVGTVLYDMAVNPVNGKVYVSNTEAANEKRFEGPGTFAGHSIRGHLHESRITVLGPGGSVAPRHLNKHIHYDVCCDPIPSAENDKSLALPQQMAVSSDGRTLYVATLGTSKIGVFDTRTLENDTFTPSAADQIKVSGGGLTGLVLLEERNRLYTLSRFDNSIAVIDTLSGAEVDHVAMHNPEPGSVVAGRPFLYDASFSSSHGDSSCASCHVFGDLDSLAWDLGNPDGAVQPIPGPFEVDPAVFGLPANHHPLKGPMTTQSLRGMANHGPMHWRGDRTGGLDNPSAQPNSGTFDEVAAFKKFQAGFLDLLGRNAPIDDDAMEAFARFVLQLSYPPNPIRRLDNQLTPSQQAGRSFFLNNVSDFTVLGTCTSCHTLDRDANRPYGVAAPGFFGTDGRYTEEGGTEPFKIPHLRNAYQKVGMFGLKTRPTIPTDDAFLGPQIRGFGFTHDGAIPTIFNFISITTESGGFNQSPAIPGGFQPGPAGELQKRQVEDFVLAFDSNLAPIVGQQTTLSRTNGAAVGGRIDLLIARARARECDLIVKGEGNHGEKGYLYDVASGRFRGDRSHDAPLSDGNLRQRALEQGGELTYTCTPPGSGVRAGIDRDEDGILDGDE